MSDRGLGCLSVLSVTFIIMPHQSNIHRDRPSQRTRLWLFDLHINGNGVRVGRSTYCWIHCGKKVRGSYVVCACGR